MSAPGVLAEPGTFRGQGTNAAGLLAGAPTPVPDVRPSLPSAATGTAAAEGLPREHGLLPPLAWYRAMGAMRDAEASLDRTGTREAGDAACTARLAFRAIDHAWRAAVTEDDEEASDAA